MLKNILSPTLYLKENNISCLDPFYIARIVLEGMMPVIGKFGPHSGLFGTLKSEIALVSMGVDMGKPFIRCFY